MNNSAAIPSNPIDTYVLQSPAPALVYKKEPDASKNILISFNRKNHAVSLNDIIRLEASSSYTQFYIRGFSRPILKSKPLKYYEQKLNSNQFIRVHKSNLVNINFIQSYHLKNERYACLKDGSKITISRRKSSELKRKSKSSLIKI